MLKIKEVLRLHHEVGLSLREIAAACNCGKSTIAAVLQRAKEADIKWPVQQSDIQLVSLLYPPVKKEKRGPEPDMKYVFSEMKRPHVTLMLLWEEYKQKNPDGVMYTQFCERYRNFKKANNLVMHKEHKAGEEVEVDWAGSTIPYFDREIQKDKKAYIFVAVLPASNYPFCYAYANRRIENWINGHVRTYEYFQGVPKITIPDNAKTAVTSPHPYDPAVQRTYHEMANHYNTTIVPARSYKPRDKGADENAVGNVSRRILAALRNTRFFSVDEINQALEVELKKFIERPFQKIPGNRKTAYHEIDKPFLQPLPARPYEYTIWKQATVQCCYHVEFEDKYYSVHYSYVQKRVWMRITLNIIEIFLDNESIAVHKRNYEKYRRYYTLPEHMPENHRIASGWSKDKMLSWAGKFGQHTKVLIQNVIDEYTHPAQSYKSCMGILHTIKDIAPDIVERTSKEANEKNIKSCKYYTTLLKQNLSQKEPEYEKIIQNPDIRGSSAFLGGGVNHVR